MLKLSRPAAEVFIPDGTSWEAASARVTHLVVAAHADDLELMAWHAFSMRRRSPPSSSPTDGAATRGIWLDHPSADVKQAAYPALAPDLSAILSADRARFEDTHNPVDFSHTSCVA